MLLFRYLPQLMLIHFIMLLDTCVATENKVYFQKFQKIIKPPKQLGTTSTVAPEKELKFDQTYADMFKHFVDSKSVELYELTQNLSGFQLINETYNSKLRQEVKISWINFTSMILDISQTIGDILYDKTLVVKNLSDEVEKAYDEYKYDYEKVRESVNHVYFDSKSPKTFCDVAVKNRKRPPVKLTRSSASNYLINNKTILIESYNASQLDYDYSDDYNLKYEGERLNELFWDVGCINRSSDTNFKSVKKVNLFESTVHVPTNIFKQEMAINMTAYWSKSLNERFRANYANNNKLDWQYFCSSIGLYRQYPAAFWSVPPKEDFFDCRLQSWYMMAATSAKDILILLDTSGSMTGIRLEIGKKLIEFMLDTFTDNDFFNIITYSSSVSKMLYLFLKTFNG